MYVIPTLEERGAITVRTQGNGSVTDEAAGTLHKAPAQTADTTAGGSVDSVGNTITQD